MRNTSTIAAMQPGQEHRRGIGAAMAKLAALNAWQFLCFLLALATAVGLSVWALIWFAWTIRPLLAAAAALIAVVWTLYAVRRYRTRVGWQAEEWLGY